MISSHGSFCSPFTNTLNKHNFPSYGGKYHLRVLSVSIFAFSKIRYTKVTWQIRRQGCVYTWSGGCDSWLVKTYSCELPSGEQANNSSLAAGAQPVVKGGTGQPCGGQTCLDPTGQRHAATHSRPR